MLLLLLLLLLLPIKPKAHQGCALAQADEQTPTATEAAATTPTESTRCCNFSHSFKHKHNSIGIFATFARKHFFLSRFFRLLFDNLSPQTQPARLCPGLTHSERNKLRLKERERKKAAQFVVGLLRALSCLAGQMIGLQLISTHE